MSPSTDVPDFLGDFRLALRPAARPDFLAAGPVDRAVDFFVVDPRRGIETVFAPRAIHTFCRTDPDQGWQASQG